MKRIGKTILAISLAVLMAFGVAACGQKAVKGTLAIGNDTAYVAEGSPFVMTTTFVAEDATADVSGVRIKWSSSKSSVATVDQNGLVSAVGVGKATITASYGGQKATCEVTVFDGENRDVAEMEFSSINISNKQDKMTINLKKKLGHYYEEGGDFSLVKDENGTPIPFTKDGDVITVDWTGAVGLHNWTFEMTKQVVIAEVCHATHILSKVEDFGPLSADWDVAVAGNTNDDPAHQNPTKDWYVVLDANLDLGMALRDTEEYTFGRQYSPGTYDAPNRKLAVFNGVFDGRGHVIKNMHTRQGFICNLGPTGVIKNLAFVACRNGEGIPYYDVDGGFLGHSGLGTVENVFIDAYLYYEDGTASAMYCHSNEQSPLRVKNCLVMFYKKPGAENWGWPDGYRLPGAFTTYGAPEIINSYAISQHFTRVDGTKEVDNEILFTSYEKWLQSGTYGDFGGLWEIGEKNIFFGGNVVFQIQEE